MNEKHIFKRKTKNGYTLRVIIKVNGKAKCFGTFSRADYVSDKMTLEAARICRDKALKDIRLNQVIIHELTVQECFDRMCEVLINNVKTKERYECRFRTSVPEKYRSKSMAKVTASDIQLMVNRYADDHSTEQVKRVVSMWSQMYRISMMEGCPLADLSLAVKVPKGRKVIQKKQKTCSAADLEIFLDGLLDYNAHSQMTRDVYLAFRVMQYLGLRPQEAFALCRGDIDLTAGTVTIQHSIGSTSEEKRQIVPCKTEDAYRVLPVPDELVPYLKELLTHTTRPLLADSEGIPYEIDTVSNFICNARKSKRLPYVTLYMMRHNFADDLTKKDVKLTQTLLGHASPEMSLKYADKRDLSTMKKALEKRYS